MGCPARLLREQSLVMVADDRRSVRALQPPDGELAMGDALECTAVRSHHAVMLRRRRKRSIQPVEIRFS